MSRTAALRLAAACGALALAALTIGALLLSAAQSEQRADQRERFAARASVAASLVDALFRTAFGGQSRQAAKDYADTRVPVAMLDRDVAEGDLVYRAVFSPSGSLLGASPATPPELIERVRRDPSFLRAALSPGRGYALDAIRYEAGRAVVGTAVAFPGPVGPRIVVSGSKARVFREFLDTTLAPLPSIERSRAFVTDGEGFVAGSASPRGTAATPPLDIVRAALSRTTDTVEISGEREYVSSAPLAGSRWRLAVSTPEATLYEPVSGALRWLPWIMLAVGGLALVGIALLLARLAEQSERLRETNAELARSNADLEQFAYAASHDLSTPLRTVSGFAQLLERRYGERLDEEAHLYLEHMTGGVERMQQLIDDLLLYSRAGRTAIGTDPVPLENVLADVELSLQSLIDERYAIVTHDPLPVVRGERGQLAQVLANLVSNAVKFTDASVKPTVHVSASREGDAWRVCVADNGIGVDPGSDVIFKMFGRLHPDDAYPGTGIGLALVKRIVERHGGHIWVEPREDGGSVFTFTLPDRVPLAAPEPVAAAV
jgi:signal transduction histidine kinase